MSKQRNGGLINWDEEIKPVDDPWRENEQPKISEGKLEFKEPSAEETEKTLSISDSITSAPIVTVDPKTNGECLLHKMSATDTMSSVAVKYGVRTTAIRKINKFWIDEDIYGKKEVLIPTTLKEFLAHESRQQLERNQAAPTIRVSPTEDGKRSELITKFASIARCNGDVALYYLEQRNYNFTKALGLFFSDRDHNNLNPDKIKFVVQQLAAERERKDKKSQQVDPLNPPVVALEDFETHSTQFHNSPSAREGPAELSQITLRDRKKLQKTDNLFDL